MLDKVKRKRTLTDRLICGFNDARYSIIEPIELKLARLKYEPDYKNSEEDPLISVYTPTYNRASILVERALPSVLAQTYKNFEYIIVGDCCTDSTEELTSQIKDSRVRFYNLPKRGYRYPPTVENHWLAGPVVPANQALNMVKGKWIARLDDDDIWTPDHLEALLRFAQTGNYEFVSSQTYEERYGKIEIVDGKEAQGPFYNQKNRPIKGNNPQIGSTHNWLYRSYLKFFKYNINCWRKSWNRVNDIDISVRMFKAGVRLGFLAKPLSYNLPRPGEQTVGLDAYLVAKDDKLKHFEFKE
jgi:glycosyltransferase involved in cell wall biosynthesis